MFYADDNGALAYRQPKHWVCPGALGIHQPRGVLPDKGNALHEQGHIGMLKMVQLHLCIVDLRDCHVMVKYDVCNVFVDFGCCTKVFDRLQVLHAGTANLTQLPLQMRAVCAFCQRRLLQLQWHCRFALHVPST